LLAAPPNFNAALESGTVLDHYSSSLHVADHRSVLLDLNAFTYDILIAVNFAVDDDFACLKGSPTLAEEDAFGADCDSLFRHICSSSLWWAGQLAWTPSKTGRKPPESLSSFHFFS
jgi:hypothetical protein